jgi:glycosyltransferase 2 family protein
MDRKKIFNIFRIFISIALMSFLVYRNRGNFADILEAIKSLDIIFLIYAALLFILAISSIVFRWGVLLMAHGYNISRPFLWQSAYIGWFYNMLLPASVGGDFYRVYDLYRNKGVAMDRNTSAVVMERIIGSLTGIVLLFIAYFLGTFSYLTRNTVIGLLTALVVILAFFIILFFPRFFRIDVVIRKIRLLDRIRPKLRDFHNMLTSYRYKKKYFFASFLLSLYIQTVFITAYYFINRSLGMGLTYRTMVFILPFVQVASSAPIAIGGMGLRENAAVFALESFGASRSDATLFSLIVLALTLLNALLGGLVYVLKNLFYRSKGLL